MSEHKTAGQIINENRQKETKLYADPIEYSREHANSILEDINKAIDDAKVNPNFKDRDFYIMVLVTRVKQTDSLSTRIYTLLACPYPNFCQTLWRYNHKTADATFLWDVPHKTLCKYILKDVNAYLNEGGNKDTADFVMKFKNKELRALSDKENGYKKDAVIILRENDD